MAAEQQGIELDFDAGEVTEKATSGSDIVGAHELLLGAVLRDLFPFKGESGARPGGVQPSPAAHRPAPPQVSRGRTFWTSASA